MRLFENLYRSLIQASAGPRAPAALSVLSFLESFILPFPPPDVMLAPMSIAKPHKAMRFATLTLLGSLAGGVVGYLIGVFGYELVQPLLVEWGYMPAFEKAMAWFDRWGFWAVLAAGFSPVPYKIFTISAGVLQLSFLPFMLASLIGRGARFFLVALLLARFGPALEDRLMRYIEYIGWALVVVIVAAMAWFSLKPG